MELRKREITVDFVENILKDILPKDRNGDLLVRHMVSIKGVNTGVFIPRYDLLSISVTRLINWVSVNSKDLAELFDIKDKKCLEPYLFLMVITHEIEHSIQFLMSERCVLAPCTLVKDGYKNLFDLFMPDKEIFPNLIKRTRKLISSLIYEKYRNELVLERNANIESLDLLAQCSLFNGRDDIYKVLLDILNSFVSIGYLDSTCGVFKETYQKLLMNNRYMNFDHNYELSMEDRVRYGLPIDEYTRGKILSIKMQSKK